MTSLKFGTSGLRGLVTELPDQVCRAYTLAFLKHMQSAHAAPAVVLVGYDLRSSSPQMAAACISAAQEFGMAVENCGPVPTPALAFRAMSLKVPAIMVTGSHIPADRNGLKFYRPDGEIDKGDEAGILSALEAEPTAARILARTFAGRIGSTGKLHQALRFSSRTKILGWTTDRRLSA